MFAISVPTGFSLTLVLRMRNIFTIPKFGGMGVFLAGREGESIGCEEQHSQGLGSSPSL